MATTEDRVRQIVADSSCIDLDEVKMSSSFKDDIGLDSLDVLEISMEIEDSMDVVIKDDELDKIKTVADLVAAVEKKMLV